jgi:hypothetical protein
VYRMYGPRGGTKNKNLHLSPLVFPTFERYEPECSGSGKFVSNASVSVCGVSICGERL